MHVAVHPHGRADFVRVGANGKHGDVAAIAALADRGKFDETRMGAGPGLQLRGEFGVELFFQGRACGRGGGIEREVGDAVQIGKVDSKVCVRCMANLVDSGWSMTICLINRQITGDV